MKRKLLLALLIFCLVIQVGLVSALAENGVTDATSFTFTASTTQEQIDMAWGEGAVEIAKNGDGSCVVKFLKDISLGKYQQINIGNFADGPSQSRVILDLNGHKISGTSIVVANLGNLTIRDGSAKNTGEIAYTDASGNLCAVQNSGYNVTVESGTLSTASSSLYSCAINTSAGENGATAISGGTLTAKGTCAIVSSGNTVINGGKIDAKYGVVSKMATWSGAPEPKIEIPAGSTVDVTTSGQSILVWADKQGSQKTGIIDIAGGAFNTEAAKLVGTVNAPDVGAANDAVNITGGTYSIDPSAYVADEVILIGYTKNKTDVLYAAGSYFVAKAMANADAGDTVTVLKGSGITVPDQVIVENKTENEITVNGEKLASNENIVAHTLSGEWASDGTYHWHNCTSCDEIADKAAHSYGEWTEIKAATYAEAGEERRTCSICPYTEIREIPMVIHDHSAVKTEEKEATCTDDGNIAYWHCVGCEKFFSDKALTKEITLGATKVPASEHKNATRIEAKAATSGAAGNITYWYCPDCNRYFSDEALTEVISKEDTIVAATGSPEPTEPVKPSEYTKSESSAKSADTEKNADTGKKADAAKPMQKVKETPKTEDGSNPALWFGLLAFAGAGMVGTAIFSRKQRRSSR